MKIIQAMAISFTLIFAGCASVPTTEPQTAYQYDKSHSKAWNIATAAGLKNIKDYVVTDHTDRNALALGGAYAAASHFAGVGFSPIGILGSIASSGGVPVEGQPHMFIWMPSELAETPEQARAYISKILLSATEKTIPEFTKNAIVDKTSGVDKASGRRDSLICIHPCKVEKKLVSPLFGKPFFSNGSHYNPLEILVGGGMQQPSPTFLGGGTSWTFGLITNIANVGIYMPTNEDSPLYGQSDKFSLAISSKLPKYFYFYLPPTETHGPLIINQGKFLYFVQNVEVASP